MKHASDCAVNNGPAYTPGACDCGAEKQHTGLPVSGYRPQNQLAVDTVNSYKADEERLLRKLDVLKKDPDVDQRWLAIGRTGIEQAFMAINRSVFKPDRVTLPEDIAPADGQGSLELIDGLPPEYGRD